MIASRLRWLATATLTVLWLAVLAPVNASTSAAASTGVTQQSTCTTGDVSALVQTLPVPYSMFRNGQDHPGLLEAYFDCQYRVFVDGATFTFCEGQPFTGGVVEIWDYKAEGFSRQYAISDLELVGERVWIDGVEQTLQRTAYKDANHAVFGIIVYQSVYFTIQLPAGDHVSTWVETYPGYPDSTATITLHILPRASCA